MSLVPSDQVRLRDHGLTAALALAVVLVVVLAMRIGFQINGLGALHEQIAQREEQARTFAQRGQAPTAAAMVAGPLDQLPAEVLDRVRRQAGAAGIAIGSVEVTGQDPAGQGLRIIKVNLKGSGDAASVDRLVRWIDRNSSGAALDSLTMSQPVMLGATAGVELNVSILAAVAAVPAKPQVAL